MLQDNEIVYLINRDEGCIMPVTTVDCNSHRNDRSIMEKYWSAQLG